MSAKTQNVTKSQKVKETVKKSKSKTLVSKKTIESEDVKEHVIVARVREPEIYGFIYGLMAETDRTMQDIIKMMIVHCAKDKKFKVEPRISKTLQKQMEAKQRKLEKLKEKVQ